MNACKSYKNAIAELRALDRKISSAVDRVNEMPRGISINRATFTAGFEGFQGGDVSMTLDVTAMGKDCPVTVGWDFALGAFEILSVALIWLVFFPPVFYRNWIATAEAREASAEES